jgi:hypothetical protein
MDILRVSLAGTVKGNDHPVLGLVIVPEAAVEAVKTRSVIKGNCELRYLFSKNAAQNLRPCVPSIFLMHVFSGCITVIVSKQAPLWEIITCPTRGVNVSLLCVEAAVIVDPFFDTESHGASDTAVKETLDGVVNV